MVQIFIFNKNKYQICANCLILLILSKIRKKYVKKDKKIAKKLDFIGWVCYYFTDDGMVLLGRIHHFVNQKIYFSARAET